ncbi:hypothetical protein KL942_002718 [Ogataea angusta]|uniref:Uncharacterized protein n=1 Tax=Pichia angusta TaxID=870730 RepID=A0ABQ7RSP3_PICAN|nr:hypothetical protein KL942_002718 [Ogataea angusta]KAG7846578.1 hypothetical protein KL940_004176 [Ogataea angusta]
MADASPDIQPETQPELNLENVLGDIKFGLWSLFNNPEFSVPIAVLLTVAESLVLKAVIHFVPYTEIDYSTPNCVSRRTCLHILVDEVVHQRDGQRTRWPADFPVSVSGDVCADAGGVFPDKRAAQAVRAVFSMSVQTVALDLRAAAFQRLFCHVFDGGHDRGSAAGRGLAAPQERSGRRAHLLQRTAVQLRRQRQDERSAVPAGLPGGGVYDSGREPAAHACGGWFRVCGASRHQLELPGGLGVHKSTLPAERVRLQPCVPVSLDGQLEIRAGARFPQPRVPHVAAARADGRAHVFRGVQVDQ